MHKVRNFVGKRWLKIERVFGKIINGGAGRSNNHSKGVDALEYDPHQVIEFLKLLGILVSLILNSWLLWEKVFLWQRTKRFHRIRKRFR